MTVWALDGHRPDLCADEPAVQRWVSALEGVASACPAVGLRFVGVGLTPAGVIARVEPDGPAADRFAAGLTDELGTDGWLEADHTRDMWYATLLHFTGPIPGPGGSDRVGGYPAFPRPGRMPAPGRRVDQLEVR